MCSQVMDSRSQKLTTTNISWSQKLIATKKIKQNLILQKLLLKKNFCYL